MSQNPRSVKVVIVFNDFDYNGRTRIGA